MNAEQLKHLIPLALEQVCSGAWTEGLPGVSWETRSDDVTSMLSVHDGSRGPYIRVHSGAATDVPFSGEVALLVAEFNKELWNGRAFLQTNPDRSLCFVVLQDNFFGDAMSYDFQPSIDDFGMRLATQIAWARRLGELVRGQFGGTPIIDEKAGVLMV